MYIMYALFIKIVTVILTTQWEYPMSNDIAQAVKLMDGTNSIQSYVEVQHKKKSVLGIKPELHNSGDSIMFLLRVRAVADPGSLHGIEDHIGYISAMYPQFTFIRVNESRSSFYITASMPKNTLYGFLTAKNGELLLKRLVYKLMLNMLSHLQGLSGAPFDDMQDGLDYTTFKFMEQIKAHHQFDTMAEQQLQDVVNSEDIGEVMQLQYLN